MLKKKENLIYLLLLVLVVASLAAYLVATGNDDTQPPALRLESDTLLLSVNDPEQALLAGVTATDDRDGDVTDLTVVEQISDLNADHTATVTYAAFDRSGNVARATRTVIYTDYTPPVLGLKEPLVFTPGNAATLLSRITVTDAIDGDISNRLKASLTGSSTNISEVGTHQVALRVTNSMGHTLRLTLPVDVLPTGVYGGTLTLTESLVYVKVGSPFHAADYFANMKLGTAKLTLNDIVLHTESDVNTSTPGVYSVAYTAQRGTVQAFSRLIVIVEE